MYKAAAAIKPVLCIPGLIYGVLMRLRTVAYTQNILRQHRLSRPVISIGNLTLGGSGKTPLVLHIARTLLEQGLDVAILTRGYARRDPAQNWILAPGQCVPSPALTLGDEPALMRRHVPSAWMGIARDRVASGIVLARQTPSAVFLLDDGFQHLRLHRDLDILVIDASQPLERNHLFPRGTLREPVGGLRRAQVILIHGDTDTCDLDAIAGRMRLQAPEARVFLCTQRIRALVPFSRWVQSDLPEECEPRPRSVFLATAVGNPRRFHRDVDRFGVAVRGIRAYRDHYRLKAEDWAHCIRDAQRQKADAIAITEKDAIKIAAQPAFPIYVAVQALAISNDGAFQKILQDCIENFAG